MRKSAKLSVLSIGIILSACSAQENDGAERIQATASTSATSVYSITNKVTYFSDEELCRATISALFSKPVKTISVYRNSGNEVRVKYTRKVDKTVWKNKCKIEGDTIIWGAVDPDRVGNENAGRWRIRYAEGDEKISYNATSEKLYLTISDELGDSSPRHYEFSKVDF